MLLCIPDHQVLYILLLLFLIFVCQLADITSDFRLLTSDKRQRTLTLSGEFPIFITQQSNSRITSSWRTAPDGTAQIRREESPAVQTPRIAQRAGEIPHAQGSQTCPRDDGQRESHGRAEKDHEASGSTCREGRDPQEHRLQLQVTADQVCEHPEVTAPIPQVVLRSARHPPGAGGSASGMPPLLHRTLPGAHRSLQAWP